jgi:hypothetical protein
MADHTMSETDQIGEWIAVLDSIAKQTDHPYREKKLREIAEFLKANRYREAQAK